MNQQGLRAAVAQHPAVVGPMTAVGDRIAVVKPRRTA